MTMSKRSFKTFVEQELGKFPHFLVYAVLEWILIIVLFVDGILAFFANEYARLFELKIPCLLCTRIDHVLVPRKADFYYNDSICEIHKRHVSCLGYCHVHKNLSDIRQVCEGCLLSFATEKDSDCQTYKSLVGILHKDIDSFVDDDQQIHLSLPSKSKGMVQAEKTSTNKCCCCGKQMKVKSNEGKNAGIVSQADAPSSRAPFTNLKNNEPRNLELPHVPYIELKLEDDESEIREEEDVSNVSLIDKQLRDDVKAATVPLLDAEDITEERTPNFGSRGNKFFGIPLTDSANSSPKHITRLSRISPLEKAQFSAATELNNGGSVTNDAQVDSILHYLKRQVRLDRKSLMSLYMELDEERSASAVAANNAMAMITKLQAGKAALQMEALQYQRMMEEQAEYDQEALQETNEQLMKREEEVKVLEAKLEAYRLKYGLLESGDGVEEDYHDLNSQFHSPYTGRSGCVSPSEISQNGHQFPFSQDESSRRAADVSDTSFRETEFGDDNVACDEMPFM